MYPELGLYIDGVWLQAEGRVSEPVINPATEQVIADLWHATDADSSVHSLRRNVHFWLGGKCRPMIVLAFRARLSKAADGGPIALVRDGDTISINVAERRMELEIDESAWEACRAALPAFE